MRLRLDFVATCIMLLFVVLPYPALGKQQTAEITVWLIPLELAGVDSPEREEQLNKCFDDVRAAARVSILNLDPKQDKTDYDQLIARGPDLAYPNLPLIKGQCETLKALDRFASDKAKAGQPVHVNVRFVWWAQAFRDLQKIAEPAPDAASNDERISPDVAQVGSTWSQYLASKNALVSQGGAVDDLDWRELAGESANSSARFVALRYTYDIRLIFYWKKPPAARGLDTPLSADDQGSVTVKNWMDASSWKSIVESLQRHIGEPGPHQRPPMAMPIGLTPNLLYDYLPLVTAGGGQFLIGNSVFGNTVSLTDSRSLSIPEYLAQNANWQTGGRDYRILAFPEMTHEEATQHFMAGDYIAIIEPLIFLKRWHKRLSENGLPQEPGSSQAKNSHPEPLQFWDYAGVAAPPNTFIGGSDLVVVRRTREKDLASALARFLATDEDYTKTLAQLGHLPAQRKDIDYGVSILADSLGDKTELTQAIKGEALDKDHEYPPRAVAWPIELESTETLEAMQRIWRRIGEGNTTELRKTAGVAEQSINERINWWVWLKRQWRWLVVALLLVIAGLIVNVLQKLRRSRQLVELERDRATTLERLNTIRGFASGALLGIYKAHEIMGIEYEGKGETRKEQSHKWYALDLAVQGWRRGLEARNWKDTPLKVVILRAIILALESTSYCKAHLFSKWQRQSQPEDFQTLQQFLRSEDYLIYEDVPSDQEWKSHEFHFVVNCPDSVEVRTPFMLEQALVCLLQNSIEASAKQDGEGHRISISYSEKSETLSVSNAGSPPWDQNEMFYRTFDSHSNKDYESFAEGIKNLLLSDKQPKPGIGLAEAYTIATQCYGGLSLQKAKAGVDVRLHSEEGSGADGKKRN